MYDDCMILSLRFPQKLWRIVNECRTGAIRWGVRGGTILLDYKQFQEQYLDSACPIFKTRNITSFIRQLNLYGFRKVTSHNRDPSCNSQNPDVHEFLHENFRSSRPDLLRKVCRKTSGRSRPLHGPLDSRDKDITEHHPEIPSEAISRLEFCRLALRRTLEQIAQDYRNGMSVLETESSGRHHPRRREAQRHRLRSNSDRSSDETCDCTCLAYV